MLKIDQHDIGFGIVVLYVQGRLTLGRSAQDLEWKVEDLLKQQLPRVVFDLSELEFLDSTGIGIIVMCAAKLKEAGGGLRIAGASGGVAHTLHLCRVPDVAPTHQTVQGAADSFAMASGAN